MTNDPDVIVIGAGAAGLTASLAMAKAGLAVTVLEARHRIGGRIFTLQDPCCQSPVELGAEFIHGKPPEIWNLLKRKKVRIHEVDGDTWCADDGQLTTCNFFSEVDQIIEKMDARKPDQSFVDFLKDCCPSSNKNPRLGRAKKWATGYVSGFNAADPALVGVHWLVKGMRAEEKIEGDRAFRAPHGYADLINIFQHQLASNRVTVHNRTVVESIRWRRGHVEVTSRSSTAADIFYAPRVLVTVPLGVLQAAPQNAGAIRFTPNLPRQKQNAIRDIMMGKVIRITLRFRQRFWEDLPKGRKQAPKTMAGLSFLLSHDDWFPTWWTTAPQKLPFLVGWAPFHCAERLSGKTESFVAHQSLQALHRLTGVSVRELETLLEHAYCHDWQSDPFSRGAYSYGKAGGDGAEQALAQPIQNTLFFAGEATDTGGHNGTVHGAMASGHRAATEIVKTAGSKTFRAPTAAASKPARKR